MILLDVNVLLAAHRSDHVHYDLVRPWFDRLLERREPFTVPSIVWAGFIRLATNRRIFVEPTPLSDAFGFMREVREQPEHSMLVSREQHLRLFEELCVEADAGGDLVADAYLAALALEYGCELVSLDRDFARFERLRWTRPG